MKLDENSTTVSECINKTVNRRINKSTVRALSTALMFGFIFIFGLFGGVISEVSGWSELTIHVFKSIFSIIYCIINFRMLYRSFVHSEKAPAIILLSWNIGLYAVSLIASAIIRDAAPFFMVIVDGICTLPKDICYLFNSDIIDNIGLVIGYIAVAAVPILCIAALVMIKKKKTIKPISKKTARTISTVFIVVSILASASSTVIHCYSGNFESTRIGNEKAREAAVELEDFYIGNPTKKEYSKAMEELEALGYKSNGDTSYMQKSRRNHNASISITEGENGNVVSVHEFFVYTCRYPYVSTDVIKGLNNRFSEGQDEEEVMKELASFGVLPSSVEIFAYDGEYMKKCNFKIDIKNDSSSSTEFDDWLNIIFEDGKLVVAAYSDERYNSPEKKALLDKYGL